MPPKPKRATRTSPCTCPGSIACSAPGGCRAATPGLRATGSRAIRCRPATPASLPGRSDEDRRQDRLEVGAHAERVVRRDRRPVLVAAGERLGGDDHHRRRVAADVAHLAVLVAPVAEAQAEVAEAMREIDANAVEIRKAGQDPEAIKATVRASLKAVEAIDVEAITRQALASVDKEAMRRSMDAAREGMRAAERELDRLEKRTRD